MPDLPHLSASLIQGRSTAEVWARGQEYYEQGAVLTLAQRGDLLLAAVEGSDYDPYTVQVQWDGGGLVRAACSCPYDWGGDCKHIVAVLLTLLHQPDKVEVRPTVDTLLADLSADQLRTLLTTLAGSQPNLADQLEARVALLVHAPVAATPSPDSAAIPPNLPAAIGTPLAPGPRPRQTPLDPQPFQRQVRALMQGSDGRHPYGSYGDSSGMVAEVRAVAEQARPFIAAGDGRNALVILDAVTAEYLRKWEEYDEEGECAELFSDLGALWIEAVLSADLTLAERKTWAKRFAEWQKELADYDVDDGFAAAEAAATQGWDYAPLRAVLTGTITDKGAWADEAPWFSDDLAVARLHILKRQGRTQEYLYLAAAEGQHEQYATMLISLDRVAEAVAYGHTYIHTPHEALALAQALRAHGDLDAAIQVAEQGLAQVGDPAPLARWLRDLATGLDRPALALRAAQIAVRDAIQLADYQALQAVAAEQWPALRAELLTRLRNVPAGSYSPARLDIFLHDGLIDDAIACITPTTYYVEVEKVVVAAIPTRPVWAGNAAWGQARAIIEAKRSNHYADAVRWLEKAHAAAAQLGQAAEWRARVQALLTEHRRKYSLVPLLESLLSRHRA
ncbi:MAG: SWIM zinc finger family protein [Chloroflexota bacterium]|nr:SWIM zinc finger family protein [Chloroflexota bacterium]